MKQTLNFTTFANTFQNSSRKNQFSYEALELIYDYIDEYERDTGEEIEFDMIAICCEWSESTPEEIARSYDIDLEGKEGAAALMHVYEYLNDETQVAGVTDKNTIVYVQF
jgi:predicted ArsR family transcriptional regulator